MAKFKPGDRFKAKANDSYGDIKSVSYDYMSNDDEYRVQWDHLPDTSFHYHARDVDDMWEPVQKLISGWGNTYCEHVWIDVGFHFSKLVCKKCDKEKT